MVSIAQNTNTHAHIIITQFGNFVKEMLGQFDAFVSTNDTKTFPKYVEIFTKIIDKHPLTVRSGLHSDLEKEANILVQKFKQPLIATQKLLQKYRGKKNCTASFIKDLKTTFPMPGFFLSLKEELNTLREKAIAQRDTKTINITKRFIDYMDQRKKDWDKTSKIGLYSALCRRMNL